jgi:Domain of unknown function (DUF4114)
MAGNKYQIDFSAANPRLYSRIFPRQLSTLPRGRQHDPLSNATDSTSVESLASASLALGQIVPFEFRISVDSTGTVSSDTISFTAGWDTVTTNGGLFGYDRNLGVISAFVDASDPSTRKDTNATITNFSWSLVGTEIRANFQLANLDPGEEVVVEAWVVLQDKIPITTTGNVQSRLISAKTAGTINPGNTINTGSQTIPLQKVREFWNNQGEYVNRAKFDTGTFTVDASGQVEFDYLYDGGWFKGELAVFSLKGMENYQPGSLEFMTEAAARALGNSKQGRILMSDRSEGARFSDKVAWENNFNIDADKYTGVKSFEMEAGDELAFMFVQNTTVQDIYQNPQSTSQWGKSVLFSTDTNQLVSLDGKGTLAFEDLLVKNGNSDRDYNDLVFQVKGLQSDNTPDVSNLINNSRDWRNTTTGKNLLEYADRSTFNEGVFEVGETGKVTFDYLYDGGSFQGELAVFSLEGMNAYKAGSNAFIAEATRRAMSNSNFGYILANDRNEGAKFTQKMPWENNFNLDANQYQGVKTFTMNPGEQFAFMLVQNTSVAEVHDPTKIWQWGKMPLFSIPEVNPGGRSPKQMVDVDGNGTYAFEDIRTDIGKCDRDYNDFIFQVKGATGAVAAMDLYANSDRDWRKSTGGRQLLKYSNRATFDEGVFQVGNSGQVKIDFLYDGGWYQGAEVGIFSLKEMDSYETGSQAFIEAAINRAKSNTTQGYTVVKDLNQGAKFSSSLKWEGNYNNGQYEGKQTFLMNPGDIFGLVLIPDGTLNEALTAPDWAIKKDPLFSMSAANHKDQIQFADIFSNAEGTVVGFEDVRLDLGSNHDYNDVVLAIEGAQRIGLADIEDVMASNRDWLKTTVGQEVIHYFD